MHCRMQILVTLCHEVLASDALDDYMENLFAQATQIRYLDSDFLTISGVSRLMLELKG